VQVPGDTNCSIVAELERATALVHEPEFAAWRNWWHLIDGKNSADNNSLLDIALLRDETDLVPSRFLPTAIALEAILTRPLPVG
jgi:hypothetical protein